VLAAADKRGAVSKKQQPLRRLLRDAKRLKTPSFAAASRAALHSLLLH
jgi:hypothetical protein